MAKEIKPQVTTFAHIKVMGIGGAGGSAVDRMMEAGVKDLEFIVINTDAQALSRSNAPVKINIGKEVTRGLGAGSDPAIGQQAAEESIDEIKAAIEGADMLFIALGAGGGTGSGAAHIVAQAARELGVLTVAFATRPFRFEGERREKNADLAISNLEEHVDTLVLIHNDKLLDAIDRKTPLSEAFKIADDVLRQGIQGISDLITVPGEINLDFADVKSIMRESGQALMGIGRASGDDRAETAARQAIESPLLDVSIDGARGVLLNVTGGPDMTTHEVNAAAAVITDVADEEVNVIFGTSIDNDLEGELIVTVVATGLNADYVRHQRPEPEPESDMPATAKVKAKLAAVKPTRRARQTSTESDSDNKNIGAIAKEVDMSLDENRSRSRRQTIDDYGVDEVIGDSVWDDDNDEDDIDRPTFLRKIRRKGDDQKEESE